MQQGDERSLERSAEGAFAEVVGQVVPSPASAGAEVDRVLGDDPWSHRPWIDKGEADHRDWSSQTSSTVVVEGTSPVAAADSLALSYVEEGLHLPGALHQVVPEAFRMAAASSLVACTWPLAASAAGPFDVGTRGTLASSASSPLASPSFGSDECARPLRPPCACAPVPLREEHPTRRGRP